MIDVPVEVKDALREGTYLKNYRMVVLNDDGTEDFTIDNNNLVKESVSIDERMVSGDTLKFGLCEGSSLEFQYFDFENINGRRIEAYCDVQWQGYNTIQSYQDVQSCGRYRIITITTAGTYRVYNSDTENAWSYVVLYHDGTSYTIYPSEDINCTITELGELDVDDYLEVVWETYPIYSAMLQMLTDTEEYGLWYYPIPMGFFDVQKCSRQASTGIIKVTAYNKLMSDYLDAKANDMLVEAMSSSDLSELPEITVDLLLSCVLKDYSVYSGTELKIDILTPYKNIFTAQEDFVEYSSNGTATGNYIHIALGAIGISFVHQFTANEIARFRIDMPSIIQSIVNSSGYRYSDSYIQATGTSGSVELMTVEDYINNALFGAYFWADYFDENSTIVPYTANLTYDYKYTPYLKHIRNNDIATVRLHRIPGLIKRDTSPSTGMSLYGYQIAHDVYEIIKGSNFGAILFNQTDLGSTVVTDTSTLPDVTLRQLQTAVFETECQFGQLSRTTDLFSGVELNHSRLYPAGSLYPATSLYPNGAVASGFKSMYSKLWADEGNVRKWRYLIITYKGLDENQQEKDFTLQRTVNADGTDDYNCSDNWLFRNLTWTAEQIGEYADAMVDKMQNVTWFPFEMWCAGLPYLETGDEIEISLGEESYTSYILQRQLKGIQNLQDTYINGTLDIF